MSLRLTPYPDYRDSGVPWLGKMPAHWEAMRGKNLFGESRLPVRKNDGIVTCFRDGQVTLRTSRRTQGFMTALLETGYQGVRRGQLVIHSMDAFAGAIGVSDSSGKCTPEYIVCDPRRKSVIPEYYAYALRIMAHKDYIRVICPAVRERAPRLRYNSFGDMFLPVPPTQEQKIIADFLAANGSRINHLIQAKRRLIKLLDEQKQVIIHRAVTRGLDPDVRLKASGVDWLGDVPEHWNIRRLKHLASMRSGESITSLEITEAGDYPVFGGNGLRGYTTSYTHDGEFVLVGRQGALCGNVNYAQGQFWASEHAVVASLARGHSLPWFGEMLKAMNLNQYSQSAAQPGLAVERIQNLSLPVPSLVEQREIADHIVDLTRRIDLGLDCSRRRIELLREYRTRLIADVVTGKLDVRGVELPELDEIGDMADYDVDEAEDEAIDDTEEDVDLVDIG